MKLKITILISLIFILYGCKQDARTDAVSNSITSESLAIAAPKMTDIPSLQSILDSTGVQGSVLIYDPEKNEYIGTNFDRIDQRFLPASTFKIPNSIIGLETREIRDKDMVFKWDGASRRMDIWEQDLTFKQAFHFSCVPCYQELARRIGPSRMEEYLNKLGFGSMEVNPETIDKFWLEGNSKISQKEQIAFLKKFYFDELPISKSTTAIMKEIMILENNESYKLSGKTGWAIRGDSNIGWFVGYLEIEDKVYFIATNIAPGEKLAIDKFPIVRKQVTMRVLKLLNIIS